MSAILLVAGPGMARAVAPASAGSAALPQEHPVVVTVRRADAGTVVRTGGRFSIGLLARIPPGWHLYSITQLPGGPITTTIAVGPAPDFAVSGTIAGPVPESSFDPNFGMVTESYEDSASFRIPVGVAAGAQAGRRDALVRIYYQACNARYCLPPREDTLRLAVDIAAAATPGAAATSVPPATEQPAAAVRAPVPAADATPSPGAATRSEPSAAAPAAAPASRPDRVEGTRAGGSLALFLWLAATMGALSLLTPCVFPMVPITISYFSRRRGASRASAVGRAALYAGGIVGAFTGLGLGFALLVGVAGLNRFAASPWLNLAIAALFVGFALSLFEVWHVALPSSLVNWLDRASTGGRFGDAGTTLLMGVTFAVTTFTCTAPFVGTLLVSATRGDWRWPAAGLLVFSSVVALPFLILALVPSALERLPRSGEWMVTLKGVLGFIELAAAFKFLSNADLVEGWGVFTRTTVVASWCVIAAGLALYLAGVRLRRSGEGPVPRPHALGAVVAVAVAVWLGTGLGGRRLGEVESFLPPAGARAEGVSGHGELPWILNDYDRAIGEARRTHRPLLIDFTGYTCTNCRWMEANMFPRPVVRRALEGFVRVRLFTDGAGELYRRQQAFEQARFQTVALPLYAVVDSLGAPRATFLGMTRNEAEFARFLAGGLATQ